MVFDYYLPFNCWWQWFLFAKIGKFFFSLLKCEFFRIYFSSQKPCFCCEIQLYLRHWKRHLAGVSFLFTSREYIQKEWDINEKKKTKKKNNKGNEKRKKLAGEVNTRCVDLSDEIWFTLRVHITLDKMKFHCRLC